MKVEIRSINFPRDYCHEGTEVYVDGVLVASGTYGGEVEDNMRCRTYSWVEDMVRRVAVACGAEVVVVREERDEDGEVEWVK